MSKRYTGGVVSSSLPTVNAAGASGVFTLNQQSAAQSTNNWPPFKVEKSLRFRAANSAYLSRTPAIASNQKTWTWSGWVKRSDVSANDTRLFGAGSSNSNRTLIAIENYISVVGTNSSSNVLVLQTSAFYRDPSAWYHIVIACDTTQSTSSNRVKIYVNGVQVTAFGTATYPSQNTDLRINSTDAHVHGTRGTYSVDSNFDGYMSEVYLIDGQALTPSSFGGTDKDGNWSPIAYTGTYGNNGFYLNFKDATSTTTLGYDYSGNGNNWTLNGFNVATANTTYDSIIDVPSDQSDGTANNRGNYCVLNPISRVSTVASVATITNGNLDISTTTSDTRSYATFGFPTSGKYYYELTNNNSGSKGQGIASYDAGGDTYQVLYFGSGNKQIDGISSSYGASYTTNDVIGVAVDIDNNQITFYKNGTNQGAISYTFSSKPTMFPYVRREASTDASYSFNFGQRPFAYTPPSGFKALNTFNLPEPTIKQPNKHFDITLWTGNGSSSQVITNSGSMQPDFLWAKARSNAQGHSLIDSVRGTTSLLQSNLTAAQATLTDPPTFNSNGFTSTPDLSTNGYTYVGWQWRASNATAVTNTSGSITSSVSANPTAGFSIVTYTGTGSNATVGHGLGVAPKMIIWKNRNATASWVVWHTNFSAIEYIYLNLTNAVSSSAGSTVMNSTVPSSSVFSLGTYSDVNGSTNGIVAYCFAQVAGYSAFGSYTGNGSSDGTFVFTGFRPRYVMIKRSNTTGDWIVYDSARSTYNGITSEIYPNLNNAEDNSNVDLDFVSNGIKLRNSGSGVNASGDTYIYACFSENPFKYARSR